MTSKIHPIRIPFQLPINEKKKVDRIVYSYIVTGKELCLIDTGTVGGEHYIVSALSEMGFSVKDIKLVINTHEHPDHVGGNTFFKENARPRFACHADAARWIESLGIQFKERPVHGFYSLAGQSIQVDQKLQDGDEIDLGGGTSLKVIFTPGHSPGSISLFCPQDGSLIVGDAIQPVDGLPLYNDLARTRESLKRLMNLSGVKKMYLAWVEKPYTGEGIKEAIMTSLDYLDRIDAMVKDVVGELPQDALSENITREVLIRVGLEPPPVMPMTIESIMTHVS
ncbi:MAG: MBL fold metallo-hydrolase [Desulfobacterales bacterium]|nr:MBL fold metallo-hydrolase [Desulfobacterales bacterium]